MNRAHLQAGHLWVGARLQQRLHRGRVAQPACDVQRRDPCNRGGGAGQGGLLGWTAGVQLPRAGGRRDRPGNRAAPAARLGAPVIK